MRTVLVKVMLALAALASPAVGAQPVTITVQVPYAKPFRTPIHETIAAEFMKHHPGIQVEFRTPYANYDDAIQQTLRGAITGDLPDITYQGLNRQRTLVDRGLAVPLTPFIEKEADWAKRGYSGALMRVGTIGGKVYGMAFAISTPVAYYNLELVRKAGGNAQLLGDIFQLADHALKLLSGYVLPQALPLGFKRLDVAFDRREVLVELLACGVLDQT